MRARGCFRGFRCRDVLSLRGREGNNALLFRMVFEPRSAVQDIKHDRAYPRTCGTPAYRHGTQVQRCFEVGGGCGDSSATKLTTGDRRPSGNAARAMMQTANGSRATEGKREEGGKSCAPRLEVCCLLYVCPKRRYCVPFLAGCGRWATKQSNDTLRHQSGPTASLPLPYGRANSLPNRLSLHDFPL